ncbi:MAG: PBP1A family penicillin-binding protein [Lachnospiraceae bacterium]
MARKKENRKRKKKQFFLRSFFKLFLLLVFLGVGGSLGLVAFAAVEAPKMDTLDVTPSGFRTEIVDDTGKTTRILAGEGANRVYVTLDRVPKKLQEAFVAIEDARFYQHHGIDVRGIARAGVKGVLNGFRFSEGASTITQQLLKNNVFTTWTQEKNLMDRVIRKVQEQYLAVRLEQKYSKEYILENYLNTINLGSGCWGIQAASMQYFGKEVSELNLSECAVLAGITKNPSGYSPFRSPESCKKRQLLVLQAMLEQGYITQEAYDEACADDVFARIQEQKDNTDKNSVLSYYEDALLEQIVSDLELAKGCTEDEAWQMIYRGGLTIYSGMNSELQKIVEEEINNDDHFSSDAQASIVLADYKTGQIKAIAGGRGEKTASLVLNRATDSIRQPGSTFKIPGEYAAALEQDMITLGTTIDDAPAEYSDGRSVRNASGKYRGMTTVREAIEDSLNIPAVKVLQETGVVRVWELLRSFGFTHLNDEDKVESLALGGTHNGVTNLQLAAAYGAIANDGAYRKFQFYDKVVDRDGNVLLNTELEPKTVIRKENAKLLTLAMEDVIKSGTGKKAAFDGMSLAGKSGTTTDQKDLWFVGYSPYYVCSVWGGYDNNQSQEDGSYVKYLWKAVMQRAHDGLEDTGFSGMEDLVTCKICTKCGKKAVDGLCDDTVQGNMTRTEYYEAGTAPTKDCDCHDTVRICTVSGEKAGEYCPEDTIQTKVYLKEASKDTADMAYVVPEKLKTGSCTEHKSWWDRWFGNGENPEDPDVTQPEEGTEQPGTDSTNPPETTETPVNPPVEKPEDTQDKQPEEGQEDIKPKPDKNLAGKVLDWITGKAQE